MDRISLNISTPTEPIRPGRGFYQLEEDILFIQVGRFSFRRRFFSYLEAPNCWLDFDRDGRLIFIEMNTPQRQWETKSELSSPEVVEAADIRFLNFREKIPAPQIFTNPKQDLVKIKFGDNGGGMFYYLGEDVIAETDQNQHLSAIWVNKITTDFAGREIRKYRKANRLVKSYFS